ncbi:MAG TPA: DUF350 domain-containing protein [Myxococcaceae bacterium]|nr:DUF350 domain-containing protein [Myxococcaceae bacterium]
MLALLAVTVNWDSVVASIVYAGVGLVVFAIGFWVVRKMMPFDVHKELEVDQNVALGIVVGSFILGLALIISAAIGT